MSDETQHSELSRQPEPSDVTTASAPSSTASEGTSFGRWISITHLGLPVIVILVWLLTLRSCTPSFPWPKINETVTITHTAGTPTAIKEIFELAVYEKEIFHNYEYKTTWLASTKRIILRGKYRIKYGVAPSSEIKLTGISDKIARLTNAPITVLSCEPIAGTLTVEEEPGLWNKLTNEERTKARNDMQVFVRNEAEKNRESKAHAMKQLQNLLNGKFGSGRKTIELPPDFLPL